MIVRMKEIVLFTLASSVDETVRKLGELGVVEIKEMNQPAGESIARRLEEVARAESAVSMLQNYAGRNNGAADRVKYNSADPKRITDRVLASADFKQQGKDKLDHLLRHLNWYQTWGERVNVRDLKYLRDRGIYIRLYRTDKTAAQSIAKDHCVATFPERDGKVPVALFSRDESEKLDLKEEPPPALPIQEIRRQITRKERQLTEVERYLEDQADSLPLLYDYVRLLKDRLGFQRTLEGMGDIEGKLKFLRGFIPRDAVDPFLSVARQQHWGYQISEPENPEEVPVYIRNPKWVEIINPVMKFIDIVPGYKEVDVSIYFLVAFALFFAMLVGDAGYGAVFLLVTFLLRKKLSSQVRLLIYVLSGATIVWGVLSGTYFGAAQIAAIPPFNNLVIEEIASFGVDNIAFMMHLSFLIGVIHLTIAHGIRCFQFINSIRALSEVGWIALMWGLFFVTETLVLGKEMPEWVPWLFATGAALVALFSVESKNLFKSMLISLSNLPLSLISGFSDIVSYVRLFAVGMATAAVAASFNHMILPSGVANRPLLELLLAAVALFLGHGLNIVLALMAVMVHGMRLNMLEFAGHLGVQFSGEAYKPFKLIAPPGAFDDWREESRPAK